MSRANSQLLQAVDRGHIDIYWNLIFTVIFSIALLIAVQHGIWWVAVTVLVSQAIAIPIFTTWIIKSLFK